ncbi:MAG: OmpA family protein [Halanaerobiaceae bacterium]|nr:OmpA family protein [Halanaerobiaceae bacterium]
MPRKRKKEDQGPPGAPAWMTTYGDMMTLVLVFFVFLYSFSVLDVGKFHGFISSFQAKLGVLDGGMTILDNVNISKGSLGQNFNPDRANFRKVMGHLSVFVEEEGLAENVSMEINERGLVINLTGQILYDLVKADIKPEGKAVLDKIAESIRDIPNHIVVEGHTDNWPINNEEFPSNWELSTTRATNVIKYFIEVHQLPPARLSAAGYSEYRPLYSNDTAENRSRNRRVEVVVLRQ